MKTLGDLLTGVVVRNSCSGTNRSIASITLDSRSAAPDALFFALPGAKTDGNRFVRQALSKGAAAVVSELSPPPAPISLGKAAWIQVPDVFEAMGKISASFYGDPSASMMIIGVTGTNGKTSTTFILESILAKAGLSPGVIGTVAHRLKRETLEASLNTTPLAPDLQRLLALMKTRGAKAAAIEISSHALVGKRADELRFDAGVFTNFQSDHLDFHGSREEYFEAKARLAGLLERADSGKKGVLIVNRDDDSWARIRRRSFAVKTAGFGFSPEADYRALEVSTSLQGSIFTLKTPAASFVCRTKLLGRHNVMNAAGAAAAALELGISPETVYDGLAAAEKVPGRLEAVEPSGGCLVLVDYAHTTDALISILSTLQELPRGRIITVFGCGGDRDKTKRAPMGAAACAFSDLAIVTSDNPRSEDPMGILREIEAGIREKSFGNYKIVPERREAIFEAVKEARDGDIVLIAGKGHEHYQILNDRTVPFDDRAAAREALKACGKI